MHETTRATRARLPLIPPIPSSPAPSEALSEASTAQLDPSPAPRSSAHHSKPHQPPQRAPMSGSTPVHTSSRFSYLSSDGVWAAKHEGLFNLGMVILLAANCRLILENLMKYGLRLHMLRWVGQAALLAVQKVLLDRLVLSDEVRPEAARAQVRCRPCTVPCCWRCRGLHC